MQDYKFSRHRYSAEIFIKREERALSDLIVLDGTINCFGSLSCLAET